jgi:hypothetical protein
MSMASKGGDLAKVLGVDLVGSNGKIKNLGQILGEFDARTKNMGDLKRMALLNEAFGKLGIAGLVIGGKGAAGVLSMASKMKELHGYTAKTADIMDSGIEGTLIRLSSAFDGIKIAIGEAIIPIIEKLGPALTAAMNYLTPVLAGMKNLGSSIVLAFTALAGGAAALLSFAAVATILSVVATAAASVVSAITGLAAAGATVAATLALLPPIIALLAIGAAGIYTSFQLWGDSIPALLNAFDTFVSRVTSGFESIGKLIKMGEMEAAWTIATMTMELAFHEAMDGMSSDWKAWVANFNIYVDQIRTRAEALKKTLLALLKIVPNAAGEFFGTQGKMQGYLDADNAEIVAMRDALAERNRLEKEWATTSSSDRRRELKEKMAIVDEEFEHRKKKHDEEKANNKAEPDFGGAHDGSTDPEADAKAKAKAEKKAADAKKEAAAAKKKYDALFEKVKYTTTASMGAMTGGSAAALSAKMSAGLLSVAKEQLSVSKSIEKNLRKDRNNKGIWAP